LKSVEGGRKFTLVLEGETGGFFRVAEPAMIRMLQRGRETDLATSRTSWKPRLRPARRLMGASAVGYLLRGRLRGGEECRLDQPLK
jgi:hypothetical protein